MARKKRKKRTAIQRATELGGGVIVFSLAGTLAGALPPSTAQANAAGFFEAGSKQFPVLGTVTGLGLTLEAVKDLQKKKGRRK